MTKGVDEEQIVGMSRPVGVTASAVVAILGSIFTLLFASMAVASLFIQTPQARPPEFGPFVVAGAVMFSALAAVGIWTSVGLFRLRSWARTSMLVFAGFLAAGSLFSLLLSMAMPMPQGFTGSTEQTFRRTMVVMFGIPLIVAIWWLVQFNVRSTKAAFASPIPELVSPRPLSITIIAWTSLVGGASCVFGILARLPAFLFGSSFTGWTAGVIYALFGALSLFIGKGLLELREEARILAIGWFGFSFVHAGLVTFVPTLRHRLLETQGMLTPNQPNPIAFDQGTMMNWAFGFATIVAATAIWFLIRNRGAFVGAEIT
jgi:hypothetical protein